MYALTWQENKKGGNWVKIKTLCSKRHLTTAFYKFWALTEQSHVIPTKMQGFIYFQDSQDFQKKYTFVSTSFKKFQHGEHIWKELIQLMTIDLETEPSAALLVVLIRMLTNQIFWGPVLRYDQQQRSHHHSLAPTTSHQERKRVRLFCVCVCGWPDQKIYRLLILYLHKKSWGKWVKKEGSSRLSYSALPNNWRENVSKRRHTTYWKDTY